MVWTPDDPGAGDPDGIRHIARIRNEKATDIRGVVTTMQSAQQQASTADWKAKSRETFVSKINTIFPDLHVLADGLDAQALALNRYAAAVERIRSQLKALQAALSRANVDSRKYEQQLGRLDNIGGLTALHPERPNPWDTPERAHERAWLNQKIEAEQATINYTQAQLGSLVSDRRNADSACATDLDAQAVLGKSWQITNSAVKHDTPAQLLLLLTGLSATDLRVLLTLHPELTDKLAQANDPSAVAAWWNGYGAAEKAALIAIIPSVIGNLNGISYTDRNIANLKALANVEDQLRKLQAEAAKLLRENGGAHNFGEILAAHGYTYSTFADAEASVKAIRSTLDSAGNLPYQLVTLRNGPPLLAAISIGDMDTASQITTAVPGMGATVASSVGSWTEAARNLYVEQANLNRRRTVGESGLAVVAWIGYDAPDTPPSAEVFSSAKAVVGASNLQSFLDGITAVHGWEPGRNLSLVGHSYGTTVVGLAATQTPVENVTFLASAGLDDSIHSVQDLQVSPHHVWATEANDDLVANIGRGSVEVGPSSGDRVAWLPSAHHVDPTAPSFGGQVFSSEASHTKSGYLAGTSGHSADPQVVAKLEGTSTDQQGYLDRHTTSLLNSGLTSLGMGGSGLMVTQ
jgi:pimeloyl-ACP methyl ester carboxylesterase